MRLPLTPTPTLNYISIYPNDLWFIVAIALDVRTLFKAILSVILPCNCDSLWIRMSFFRGMNIVVKPPKLFSFPEIIIFKNKIYV